MRNLILIRALPGSAIAPPGTVVESPTTRSGFLICNGCAVSKEAFPELYAVVGDRFMLPGDRLGTKLFRLPKLAYLPAEV